MADVQDDDQWLYGDEKDEAKEDGEIHDKSGESKGRSTEHENVGNSEAHVEDGGSGRRDGDSEKDKENEKEKEKENEGDKGSKDKEGEKEGNEKGDDDSSDEDDLTITIGVLKTQPDIIQAPTAPHQARFQPKQATQTAGLKDDDFTSPGKVNGVPVTEYNIAELEDKPWRKPGADISDYFNYGFNEETWYKYCERQKRMRINESGAGLGGLGISVTKPFGHVSSSIPVTIVNDNSKYGGAGTQRKAGPPPRNRGMGHIDVIGGAANSATKTSTIQVMTADRREYSNKVMNGPPPSSAGPGYDDMEFGGNPYGESYYPGEGQFYGSGGAFDNPTWAGGVPPPSVDQTNWGEGPQAVPPPAVTPVSTAPGYFEEDSMSGPPASSEPDEERHRSRRHRSRSRSPSRHSRHSSSRHARSRSRSPSHRHKRKKAKRERDAD